MLGQDKILTLLDVEKGKGGSGDKERVYVVKTSGCQKICMFLALIAIGGFAFMMVQSNQIEMQKVITRLTESNAKAGGHRAEVQTHEETAQHHSTLVELQNHLRQEVAEQQEDQQLSDQAIKAVEDSQENDKVMLKKFMKDLESNIHNSVDKKISEAIKLIKDESAQEKLSSIKNDMKDAVTQKIQKVEKHIKENLGEGQEKVKELAQQFADDSVAHGQEASTKLTEIVQMIKDKEMTLMESNSRMYELVDKGLLSKEEVQIMLANLQVRLPQVSLFLSRKIDLLKNQLIPSAFSNTFFDRETIKTVNQLSESLKKAEIADAEVADILNDMSKDGSIPPPADNHATIAQYIADLQKSFEETVQVRKGEQVILDLGRFAQMGGDVTFSLTAGFAERTGMDIDPKTGQVTGTVKEESKKTETVEVSVTNQDGESDSFWMDMRVYDVDENPLTRNAETQNKISEQLTKVAALVEQTQSWATKTISDEVMLGYVKKGLKDRILSAALLFTTEESEQATAATSATANKDQMNRDVVEWLRNGLEQMKTNTIDKAAFWKEVVNKYNEGLIPADVMEGFRRQMGQHMDSRKHHREHHLAPNKKQHKKAPHAPKPNKQQVQNARTEARKEEANVQQAAKKVAKTDAAENQHAVERAKHIAHKMKNPNLTPQQRQQLAQEMDQMKTAHTPKAQERIQQVTATHYQMRPLVMHEGHTVGGPWTATMEQCKQQCDITPTCMSFSYSETRQECALKDMCVQGFAPAKPEDKRGDWMTYFKPCAETSDIRDQRIVNSHHQQIGEPAVPQANGQGSGAKRQQQPNQQQPESNNPWLNQQFPNQRHHQGARGQRYGQQQGGQQQGVYGQQQGGYGQQQRGFGQQQGAYGQQQRANGQQQQQQQGPYVQQQQQQYTPQ